MSDNKRTWRANLEERERKIKGFSQHGRILVSDSLKRELEDFCGVCGKPFGDSPQALHFGEYFHKTCVVKMQHGEKP